MYGDGVGVGSGVGVGVGVGIVVGSSVGLGVGTGVGVGIAVGSGVGCGVVVGSCLGGVGRRASLGGPGCCVCSGTDDGVEVATGSVGSIDFLLASLNATQLL